MLLHKRKALRKAFALVADLEADDDRDDQGHNNTDDSAVEANKRTANKQLSFDAFDQLIRTYIPGTSTKVCRRITIPDPCLQLSLHPQEALLTFEYLDRVNMNSPGAANKALDRQVNFFNLSRTP